MADSTFFRGLALWFVGFAVLALFGGGVLGVSHLVADHSSTPMDAVRVSNDDDANHTVRLDVSPINESATTFAKTVRLRPGETVSFDEPLESGRQYRLLVAVDGEEAQSFEVDGPDDHCTIGVYVESDANATVVSSCA